MRALTRTEVFDRLASSIDRNDQAPNIKLAEVICRNQDKDAITFVVDILQTGSRSHQNDAIKVLYEIGTRYPESIAPHSEAIAGKLDSGNNRIVWGVLMALAKISKVSPERVVDRLDAILEAADNGSVIAKDQAIEILISLRSVPEHFQAATSNLFDRIEKAAINQFPKYAEMTATDLRPGEKNQFLPILKKRLSEHMPESKRKRLNKVMAKVDGMAN